MNDDAGFHVFHAACAAALALDIQVDLCTFFNPPAPYPQLFVLTALVDQAFTGRTRVSCAIGTVVAVRRRKGQLLAMIRGWGGCWYSVDSVYIVYAGRTLLS